MQTIDQLCSELKLNQSQADTLKVYLGQLIVDLLESIRDDNIKNFNETIDSLRGQAE